MKLKVYHFTTLALVILMACTSPRSDEKSADNEGSAEETTTDSDQATPREMCFLETVENTPIIIDGDTVQRMIDSTQLSITIDGSEVTGIFNYIPAESDARIGTFAGSITGGSRVKAIYVFAQEGDMYKEGLILDIMGEAIGWKLAELDPTQGSGELEILDNNAPFELLAKTDCATANFMKYDE